MSEAWEILWDRAMLALDSLKRDVDWSFGSGTAMRLFHDHRESKDVDIFVIDPYVISALSPRLNGITERLTGDYSEMSNFLKLRFPEGAVDFIIAPKLVDDVPFVERVVRGRSAKVESPLEIVAKKCFYRADDFTARDIFDLAVLIHDEPQAVERHRGILLAKRSNLERRLGMMRLPNGADAAAAARAASARERVQEGLGAIAARPAYAWVKSSAIDTVLRFLEPQQHDSGPATR
ncbi:MAG: hypothetical protein QOI11_664 [Candidatus Eremiobacteraeota bacterium]|nr:hypothetical protein [Candidatus Eremiobacteraeota bacterium]